MRALRPAILALIGMGFSEQLGLLALPSWKLGNFGLGFRRFGVDGIEGRDGRGTLTEENLEDAESELLLGYARPLGHAWHMGLLFKYQQQELAGYSDGAPGLDVGFLSKPLSALGSTSPLAEELSLGLAIRNLIEPEIRLVDESVKDPTGLRLGLALDHAFSENVALLVTTDLEKTRDMDTHLHAGAELRLLDLLALRVGSHVDMLTAGAGVRYRNLAVQYAFEDNVIETVHRFGVGLSFGPSVSESRQAHLAAEEAMLQERITRTFQEREQQRLEQLLQQINAALADEDFASALNHVATCRILAPEHPELDRLAGQAHLAQGRSLENAGDLARAAVAYQRCLAVSADNPEAALGLGRVSDRSNLIARRSRELKEIFNDAVQAYAHGDLEEARNGFTRVLELSPEDPEARALLESTEATLRLQAEARQALARADEAQANQPAATTGETASLELPTPETVPVPAAPKLPSFQDLTGAEKQEIQNLYRQGLQAVREERSADAVRYFELVWSRAPDYQAVAENLKREYLVQGMEAFSAGRLDESIAAWRKADQVVPGDPRTRGYLARAYEHKARIQKIRGEG